MPWPMPLTIDELVSSPDNFLHSFEGDDALFVSMNRASYHNSIFLDRRIAAAQPGIMRVPISMLAAVQPMAAPMQWIFHIAHCGSTLLARALDDQALNLVLREPLALRQTAIAADEDRLTLVTAMLSKRYRPDAATIVKANVPVNFILKNLVESNPGSRAIFIHYSLQEYVLAILRDDKHRTWLRNVTTQLSPRLGDLSGLNDGQRAAALWAAQIQEFAAAIAGLTNARTLDAEFFFAEPVHVLRAAVRHFQVDMSDAAVDKRVAGELFSTYSKNPQIAFDNRARISRRQALERELALEVADAHRWIEPLTDEIEFVGKIISQASLS